MSSTAVKDAEKSEFQYHLRTLKIEKEMATMGDMDMLNST